MGEFLLNLYIFLLFPQGFCRDQLGNNWKSGYMKTHVLLFSMFSPKKSEHRWFGAKFNLWEKPV